MASADLVQRVRIYLNTDDRWEGGPLYLALLDELRRSGATGATALQGLSGFGPGHRVRVGLERGEGQPVVVEWIDRAERIARLLPQIDRLVGDALITLEDVPVYRALMRARGPFAADRGVGDIMRRPAPAVAVDAPLSAALDAMIQHGVGALPVVQVDGLLVGLITEQDLAWRAGLRIGLPLLDLLTQTERDPLLTPLIGRVVREVMTGEPRSVLVSSAIPQALVTMIEAGYSHLPVVERDGRLAGLLGPDEVLQAAVEQAVAAESAVRDAEPPAPVHLVMRTATAQVAAGQPIALALAQILAAPDRRVLVTDSAGKLIGMIDAAAALRGLEGEERTAFIAALQRPTPPSAAALPGTGPLDPLMIPAPPGVAPELPAIEAARRLLEQSADNLPVVHAEGRLLGIIARGGLVRALMQQSE